MKKQLFPCTGSTVKSVACLCIIKYASKRKHSRQESSSSHFESGLKMLTVMTIVSTRICKPNFWEWFFRLKKPLHLHNSFPHQKNIFSSPELLIAFSQKLTDYQHHLLAILHTCKPPKFLK